MDQAFVGRVVAQHPAATVEEHKDRQRAFGIGWAHDFELDRLTIDLDGLVDHLDPSLCANQYSARLFRAQLFEGLATASGEGIEETLSSTLHPGATSGKRAVDGKGEYGDRQTLFDVHVQPPGAGR